MFISQQFLALLQLNTSNLEAIPHLANRSAIAANTSAVTEEGPTIALRLGIWPHDLRFQALGTGPLKHYVWYICA